MGVVRAERPIRATPVAPGLFVPYPQLYRTAPFRLTLLGLLTLVLTIWCTAESVMCANYCRPAVCSKPPCVWSPEDPTWGVAVPQKIDEWTTGGRGRDLITHLADEWDDLVADAWDYFYDIDIRSINPDGLDFLDRRQHRRRLRKRGLLKPQAEPLEHKEKWDAWRAARIAKEKTSAAREMGYEIYDETESMSDDAQA